MNVVAIDGYSACGKSTLAKDLANHLEWVYVDTGAMYRAVTYYFLQSDLIRVSDSTILSNHLNQNINLEFSLEGKERFLYLNGKNIEEALRSMEVAHQVSKVAAIPVVREAMVKQQQAMGERQNLIMDGRDIGTVVFPNAFLKIFLTADHAIRLERRTQELTNQGRSIDINEISKNLRYRDYFDTTRSHSPLRKAKDAIVIDNSNLTKAEQNAMVLSLIETRLFNNNGA